MTQPLVRAEPASSLSLCFISLSLSLVFFIFSFSFFQLGRTSTILGMQGFVARCIPITPTLSLSFIFFTTPRAKCAKPVSPTECVPSPRVPLVQFSCFRASHAPRV